MKKLILTIVTASVLQIQVYGQLVNYNDKGDLKALSQKTNLKITGLETKLFVGPKVEGEQSAFASLAAAATILPPVIDLVISSAKEKAKKNALAYKSEYKCSASGDNFYKDSASAFLPKMTITRTIKLESMSKGGADTAIAVEIELVPELSTDKTAFRYAIRDKCVYNYSLAKTHRKYDYIDVDIEINFKSISINKDEYKIADLRTTMISIPMVHVGDTKQLTEKVYSGWIPLPPRSTVNQSEAKTDTKNKTKKSDADDNKNLYNTGLYEVQILVTETNPYKIKAENKQAIIESSNESITAILNAVLVSYTKDKESDDSDK